MSCVMVEFIHWEKFHILLTTTCDEILSWMIKIWLKIHLVSDSKCNYVNLYGIPKQIFSRMTNNVGLTLSVVTLYRNLQLGLSKTIRMGDTKCHV